jgi:transcription elongation factor GreA
VTEASVEIVSIAEAAQRYLASLRPKARQDQAPEVWRFVDEMGRDTPLNRLRAVDLERYCERNSTAADAQRRLETVRGLLNFARRHRYITENLASHVRVRRTVASGGNVTEPPAGDRVEMTAEGRTALERELEELRAQRPTIAEALRAAMADKDFRENAPLDAAREQQAHLEARIRELESLLKRAVVVERPAAVNVARMGSRVRLRDLESGREVTYLLVGPGEVNAAEGKISVSSPVGRALMDRSEGEEVVVEAPARTFRYRIEQIEPATA